MIRIFHLLMGPLGPLELLGLGWLACCAQPWLGLAWGGLACLALAWSSNNNRPPSAAGGGCAAAVFVAGKAGKTGPGQTKPRQGTTSKPASQAKAGWPGCLAGWPEIWIFFDFFFGSQNGLKWCPRALGGPGGYFPLIFDLFWVIFGQFFPLFPPLGPYFWAPY